VDIMHKYKMDQPTTSKEFQTDMRIAIIGSGVVGEATGIGISLYGHSVLFHDINDHRLAALKEKGYEITTELLEAVLSSDVVFVCVPTPTVDGHADLTYVKHCAKAIGEVLKKSNRYVVVVFKSTIPPQTTRTQLIPILEQYSGLRAGEDFGVCMNPEFLRQQSALDDFLHPSRIVIGEFNKKSGDFLERVYKGLSCPIIRTDLDTAEMVKYVSNLFLASKISFFNEIFMVCQKIGVDARTVSKAVSLDSRIGSYGVNGGKPFDGMCFPKDLAAFITYVKSKGINPKLLEAVQEINREIASFNSLNNE
jgi:UDPglucose 6-dehydrogenase